VTQSVSTRGPNLPTTPSFPDFLATNLPPHIQGIQKLPTQFDLPDEGIMLKDIEKKLIHRAIEKAGGNKSKAAKLLGITRRKLYSMLERFGVGVNPKNALEVSG
jgi:DNA-binding NtrC family response regulator